MGIYMVERLLDWSSTSAGRLSAPWNAARVSYYVTPREVREDVGLTPAELAERLGMNLDAYLDWETHRVVLRDEAALREQELVWPIYLGWASVLVALVTVCVMWLTGFQLAGVGLSASAVAAVAVCLIYHDRVRAQRREIEVLRGEVQALRSMRE